MRKIFTTLVILTGMMVILKTSAQESGNIQTPGTAPSIKVYPSMVGKGTFWGVSKPLKDLPVLSKEEFEKIAAEKNRERNEEMSKREYPFSKDALPKGDDPAWQKDMGPKVLKSSVSVNFAGQSSPSEPPDDNGAPGPNHYMQTINCAYTIYNKSGTLLAGPTELNLIFGNVPGATRNDGDPIVLYDAQADRWLVTEFSTPGVGQDYILMAVSTTNDPTGTWYQYSFPADKMPDYPKFGVWRDGYYMGNNNTNAGNDIYVYERSKMLTGQTAQVVSFRNPNRPGGSGGFRVVPPVDNSGQFAPEGSPGIYIAFNDDASGGGSDQLWIYELAVNWNNLTASTFNRVQQIGVQPFNCNFGPTWDNIRQKGTTQMLDAVPSILMNMPQYRNFGSYQTIVCCHSVNVDGNRRAGIRWYELRKTTGEWSIRQQGTYSPDTNSRWMGSIRLNSKNTIALGYSVSSAGEFPGIRFCGQSSTAYLAGNSLMDIAEDTIMVGGNSQTVGNRWGDYSSLSLDPADDETFWFTTQYEGSSSRETRIAAFKFNTPSGNAEMNQENQLLKIIPNPNSGSFTIVTKQPYKQGTLSIEDLSGRQLVAIPLTGLQEYSVSLPDLSQGTYLVVLKTGESTFTARLVIYR